MPRHRPSLSANGSRGGRKSESSECEASINQHNPSFEHRDRGTNADDAVQRKSSTCHRGAGHGVPWKQRECQEQAHRASTSVVFGSRRSATLPMRLDVWSYLHKRSGRMVTSTQTEELAIHPSELHASRSRGGCSSRLHEKSQVRRATA